MSPTIGSYCFPVTIGGVNVAANALINVDAPNIEFEDPTSLNLDSIQDVISSLEVNNKSQS